MMSLLYVGCIFSGDVGLSAEYHDYNYCILAWFFSALVGTKSLYAKLIVLKPSFAIGSITVWTSLERGKDYKIQF